MNVIPRVLADDLMVFATGTRATVNTALALLTTHEYILDIRGLVETDKTWAFAHDLASRELLRLIRFPGAPGPCLIKHEGMDLEGHFDTTLRGSGTTINQRLNLATGE